MFDTHGRFWDPVVRCALWMQVAWLAAAAVAPAQNTGGSTAPSATPSTAVLTGDALFREKPRILHSFDGESAGDQFGWVARVIGDLDGDGVLDFVTSSPTSNAGGPGTGRIYAYSGKSGALLFQKDGAHPGDLLGMSIACAGDVDGDGTMDVAVGAPGSGAMPGRALVFSGKDGSVVFEKQGTEAGAMYGRKVCGVGDLNDDGHGDLAIGAMKGDTDGGTDAGWVEFVSGIDGSVLHTIYGDQPGGNFGSGMDSTMDAEHPLFIAGAMNEGKGGRGRAHVYLLFEEAADPLWVFDAAPAGANFGQFFVSILGDVDGDGTPDLYAADFSDSSAGPGAGRIVVHSGATGELLLEIRGHAPGEGFGTSPSVAGDVDGDGHADLIVGAWQNGEGGPSAGKCYLHSGKDGSVIATYTCLQPQDTFGFDAVGIGDVDGDGGIDFLLTSAWSPVHGPKTGRVFVLAGPVKS